MEAPPPLFPVTTRTAPLSLDSSLHSLHTDHTHPPPPPQPPQKLRLMCSSGGHIVPRPHDQSLCYISGDTRIVLVDRHISLSDLRLRLSKTFLHHQSFSLKYQLPDVDLDCLISITTDEDLRNMVEEYDGLNNAGRGPKLRRLRLFLFPKTPSNIEELLLDTAFTKSDDWFFDALNSKDSALSAAASIDRGFSDSCSVNNLLGLDDDDDDLVRKLAKQAQEGSKIGGRGNGSSSNAVINPDVLSVPDSRMLETTSSFGSSSSSLSAQNLQPPTKVHVEEYSKVGGLAIGDQFQQLGIGVTMPNKQDEACGFEASGMVVGRLVSSARMVVVGGGENADRVISDDERSDHGECKKVKQIQQQGLAQLQYRQNPQIQLQQTGSVALDFNSSDSLSSEGSYTNPLSRQRHTTHQEPVTQIQSMNTEATVDPKTGDQSNAKIQLQPQLQESGNVLSGQYEYDQSHSQLHQRQRFVLPAHQYFPAEAALLAASYYPIYPSQQQQQQHRTVYFLRSRPTQAYNIPSVQQLSCNSRPATTVPSGCPQLVQILSSQLKPQYAGYIQIRRPSQPINPDQFYS